jgi:hypothetical protein
VQGCGARDGWRGASARQRSLRAQRAGKVRRYNHLGHPCGTSPARLADVGAIVLPGSPTDFGRLVAEETEKWGKVVKFAGTKAE